MGCKEFWKIDLLMLPTKVAYFTSLAAIASLLPYLGVYMLQLGLSNIETGIIYGCMPFLRTVLSPLLGVIADRLKKHKLALILCCILSGVCFVMLMFVPTKDVSTYSTIKLPVTLMCEEDKTHIQVCAMPGTDAECFLQDSNNTDSVQLFYQCTMACDVSEKETLCLSNSAESDISCGFHLSTTTTNTVLTNLTLQEVMDSESTIEVTHENSSKPTYDLVNKPDSIESCSQFAVQSLTINGSSYDKILCQTSTSAECKLQCKEATDRICTTDKGHTTQDQFGKVFWLFFVIYLLGNIPFSPIIDLIGALTYDMLGDKRNEWGKHRLWGTIGFAVFAFSSGFIVDVVSGKSVRKDYSFCFIAFLVLHIICAISVWFFKLSKDLSSAHSSKNMLHLLKRVDVSSLLAVLLLFGMFTGVIELFLYRHLKAIGGNDNLLLGLCMLLNCLPEIVLLFVAGAIIKRLGHVRCLYLAFLAYAGRFVGYSFLVNPWFVLFIEPLHGIAFALMYSAASSYASLVTPAGMHGTVQGMIGGVHFGFGKGIGSVLGGFAVEAFGAVRVFQGCAIMSGIGLLLYMGITIFCIKPIEAKDDSKKHEMNVKDEKEKEEMMKDHRNGADISKEKGQEKIEKDGTDASVV